MILLVGAAVLIDTTFFAVVAPLLPELSHSLHLSKLGAGILTASYPAGMLVASLPAGVFAVRLGPRVAVCCGLGLLVVSTVAFSLLHSAAALDLARFAEGVGGASSWSGGMAWLVQLAPPGRRGAVIGQAVSAAIAGAVAGPAVGALASLTGRPALFIALAGLALVIALIAAVLPVPAGSATIPEPPPAPAAAAIRALVSARLGVLALWLMVLAASVSGTLTVLGSLRLHGLGAGAGVIGATFIVGAGLETAISSWVGGVSDRHGRLAPLVGSLALAGMALVAFSLVGRLSLLIATVVLAAMGTGAAWTPIMALLSDLSEAVGLDQALGAALMNLAWAGGQILGAGGGGALARLTSTGAAAGVVAGLCLLSAVTVGLARGRIVLPAPGGTAPAR